MISSGAVFCQLSTLKSIVTLTVRVQYADYHPQPSPPCQSIRVSQSNSDSTRTVRVTLTYADTLTRAGEDGRVVFRILYAHCQSYSDLRGYSDKGG